MDTDTDGNMGPATDRTLAWMGALMDEMGWASPSPKLRGEASSDFD